MSTLTADTIASSLPDGIDNRSNLDRADDAHNRLTAVGTVLTRLFEYAASHEYASKVDTGTIVDFCQVREFEFWEGLRILTRDMVEDAETVKAALDSAAKDVQR